MAAWQSSAFSACKDSVNKKRLEVEFGDRSFSALKRNPEEIGYYSLNENGELVRDKSQLWYLETSSNRHKKMDLNDGFYDRLVTRGYNTIEGLESLLKWIDWNLDRVQNQNCKIEEAPNRFPEKLPEFIMSRGKMTKIMCTPYENEAWMMTAEKLGSTIYITETLTPESNYKQKFETDQQKKMGNWGHRFEKYMTRPDPPTSSSAPVDQSTVVVNTNAVFRTVLELHLGKHNVMYSGEVDCREASQPGVDYYVELKTKREFSWEKQKLNFHRYTTKKWWAQSYLAKIPKIICGFRNDYGVVVRIEDFNTEDLPKDPRGGWDKTIMLLYLNKFFDEVKKAFAQHTSSSVIVFSFKPEENKVWIKPSNREKDGFLPKPYIQSLKAKNLV